MLACLSEEARASLLAKVPLGRFGQPSEVAAAVLFLLSPENTFITGQILVIDGGVTLQ
jgi:3-oxoacyl-[acyl-carrier protein] reductase